MILKADRIADRLENREGDDDPLVITPEPNLESLRTSGSGSIDLRLGTWFVSLRQSRASHLELRDVAELPETSNPVAKAASIDPPKRYRGRLTRTQYVPFGEEFYLHPRQFVLGVTLEWVRFPKNLAGYVVGKSSWGRRGLIIATAVGVHPGFAGCLTLEITNLGEMPIQIIPGMEVCQLFIHQGDSTSPKKDKSGFSCKRRPVLGEIELDDIAKKLRRVDPVS
jgi:dCTP deaminase